MNRFRLPTWPEIEAEVPHVDDADVHDRLDSSPALRHAPEMNRPENWWGSGVAPDRLLPIAAEGIPLVWIPPKDVVVALAAAPTREARLGVLDQQEDLVLGSCTAVVESCDYPEQTDNRTLTLAALNAFQAGHHQAAMALAVALGEPLAAWASTPRVQTGESVDDLLRWQKHHAKLSKYNQAQDQLTNTEFPWMEPNDVRRVLLAPIASLFTGWWPSSGVAIPEAPSRHVVAHNPTVGHMNRANALLALMLVSSILAEQREWLLELEGQ